MLRVTQQTTMDILRHFAANTTHPSDEGNSLEDFSGMLTFYAVVLSVCSVVSLINYHRFKYPIEISLSLSGLLMSIVLVVIDDAILSSHPIASYVGHLIDDSDLDEIILRFGVGFIMFASAMESDIRSLKTHWGLVFLLSVCGVIVTIVMCATACFGLFHAFGFWGASPDVITPSWAMQFLVCILFGCIVAPTDAHHFILEALHKSGAPESFSAIVVGEGLTNDALAVVAFTVAKTLVDQLAVEKEGGCTHISDQAKCETQEHQCEWTKNSCHYGPHGEMNFEGIWGLIAVDIFGGFFVGLFMAWIFSSIMKRVREPNINIILSITLVLDIIVVSDHLDVSYSF